MSSKLDVDLRLRLDNLTLAAAFTTVAPWTVLFGPSGSGKSTLLRAIAGLEHPTSGHIRLNGATLFQAGTPDPSTNKSIPAWQRPIRWSAQRPILYPHMTVAQNLAFATPNPQHLSDGIQAFHLAPYLAKRPSQLSGGEAQRIAVARAAISTRGAAALLLLDEPFSGLDRPIRDRFIADLRTWLAETPVLSVTHDVAEAFLLDAHVVRIDAGSIHAGNMDAGRIVAQGPAAEVLAEERRHLLATL